MTPSERERRIEAARGLSRDELVEKVVDLQERASLGASWLENAHERAERAEAAARDFRAALEQIAKQDATCRLGDPPWKHWRTLAEEALESSSGEEGTEG